MYTGIQFFKIFFFGFFTTRGINHVSTVGSDLKQLINMFGVGGMLLNRFTFLINLTPSYGMRYGNINILIGTINMFCVVSWHYLNNTCFYRSAMFIALRLPYFNWLFSLFRELLESLLEICESRWLYR